MGGGGWCLQSSPCQAQPLSRSLPEGSNEWGSPGVKLPAPCCPPLASPSPITTATTSQEGLVSPLQPAVQPILPLRSGVEGVRGKSDGQGEANPAGHRWQTESRRTQPCWGGGLLTYGRGAFLGPELPLLPPGHSRNVGHLTSWLIGRTYHPPTHILVRAPEPWLPARGRTEKPGDGL